MDKTLLDLAAESVFCSDSIETRYAESSSSKRTLGTAIVSLVTVPLAALWWVMPTEWRGDLHKSLGLLIPISALTVFNIGISQNKSSQAESFEAAYKMKCNYCRDDERCQSLYGPEWDCVEGECMERVAEEDDDNS
tara:strand:+ start:124 stop:531 length:408 start_codon:yes stop_codon:yes gene_type:complete